MFDDTIETLSVSEVDAEGEVFGDAAEIPKPGAYLERVQWVP